MRNGFRNACHAQETFVINVFDKSLTTTTLFQIDQMEAPSFLLHVLSHTFPHFSTIVSNYIDFPN